jgi:hypothetical protein
LLFAANSAPAMSSASAASLKCRMRKSTEYN